MSSSIRKLADSVKRRSQAVTELIANAHASSASDEGRNISHADGSEPDVSTSAKESKLRQLDDELIGIELYLGIPLRTTKSIPEYPQHKRVAPPLRSPSRASFVRGERRPNSRPRSRTRSPSLTSYFVTKPEPVFVDSYIYFMACHTEPVACTTCGQRKELEKRPHERQGCGCCGAEMMVLGVECARCGWWNDDARFPCEGCWMMWNAPGEDAVREAKQRIVDAGRWEDGDYMRE